MEASQSSKLLQEIALWVRIPYGAREKMGNKLGRGKAGRFYA